MEITQNARTVDSFLHSKSHRDQCIFKVTFTPLSLPPSKSAQLTHHVLQITISPLQQSQLTMKIDISDNFTRFSSLIMRKGSTKS